MIHHDTPFLASLEKREAVRHSLCISVIVGC